MHHRIWQVAAWFEDQKVFSLSYCQDNLLNKRCNYNDKKDTGKFSGVLGNGTFGSTWEKNLQVFLFWLIAFWKLAAFLQM